MDSPNSRRPGRKRYRAPSLVSYGDLAKVTHAVGMSGMLDGGMKPNRKSQP